MRRLTCVSCALVLGWVLLAASAASAPSLSSPPLPAQVQALLARTAALQISSERFSQATTETRTVALRAHGRVRHVKRSLTVLLTGEVDLAAQAGRLFISEGGRRVPSQLLIGSTVYLYSKAAARIDGGRPWVRTSTHGAVTGASLLPFHGGGAGERNAGGTGPYAGLLNLLATAGGAVAVGIPSIVHGRPATQLEATVDPFQLLELPARELSELRALIAPEAMRAYLDEAGLPLRVIEVERTGLLAPMTQTTDVLAVNVPVSITAPPARRTIGQAALERLERRRAHARRR